MLRSFVDERGHWHKVRSFISLLLLLDIQLTSLSTGKPNSTHEFLKPNEKALFSFPSFLISISDIVVKTKRESEIGESRRKLS